ncbi:hypothetical protein EPI10_011176 [Gossypium australe]|uniref:Uncharacterized protein n=1 Tax=Gossypium australe TaxID=47621 RepID=A0A5B6W7Y8_9ROSI|nr:hypothetical protein EPI10_011176 [Gossypium australe]
MNRLSLSVWKNEHISFYEPRGKIIKKNMESTLTEEKARFRTKSQIDIFCIENRNMGMDEYP